MRPKSMETPNSKIPKYFSLATSLVSDFGFLALAYECQSSPLLSALLIDSVWVSLAGVLKC